MARLKPKSIAAELTRMNILVSVAALVVCCAAFLSYDLYAYRDAIVRTISIQAQIIGFNSVSALTFNDPAAAQSTLSALSTSPNILSAGILTSDGRLFARYAKAGFPLHLPAFPTGPEDQHSFTYNSMLLVHPIVFQDKIVGAVYIRSDLQRLFTRIRQYLVITLLVVIASLIAAFVVSAVFRRTISDPIVRLAEIAGVVSREKNYSLRAVPSGEHDELATLIASFNEMLSQIQVRDEALKKAHAELEMRVQERTRQLVAANKELEAFSYSVSHDLRAPLEVINGFSYVLQTDHENKLDANGRECLNQVRTATQRMGQLIEDLLNLSRVSTSAMQREKVNLSSIARSIADELHRQEPERHVEFVISPNQVVQGDLRFLRIILENLLRNAWKYTSRHAQARIEFGSEERRGMRVYFVRDDGAGFDPRRAGRLFQPFQRLHAESEFSGNGVGLATVQRIVERHAGSIWATGAEENGATFYFTIGDPATSTEPADVKETVTNT
jgi:signal transduction histidine kinase